MTIHVDIKYQLLRFYTIMIPSHRRPEVSLGSDSLSKDWTLHKCHRDLGPPVCRVYALDHAQTADAALHTTDAEHCSSSSDWN